MCLQRRLITAGRRHPDQPASRPTQRVCNSRAVTDPQLIDWDQQEFTEARPGIFGATVHTPQLTAILYRYAPGSSWEEHQHPQDQITTVLEGEIDFIVAG